MKAEWLFFDVGTTLIGESKAFDHRTGQAALRLSNDPGWPQIDK